MASCPAIDQAYGPESTDIQIQAAPSVSKCCERRNGAFGCENCRSLPIPGGSGASAIVCASSCDLINQQFPGEHWEPTGYTNCTNTNLPCADSGITYQGGVCQSICTRRLPTMTPASTEACCGFNSTALPSNPIGTCAPGFCPNGPQCAAYVESYCSSNLDPTTGMWPAACDDYLSNTANGAASSLVISTLAEKYLTIPYTGVAGSNPFAENYAAKYCAMYPGACSSVLESGFCSSISRSDLIGPSNQLLDANLIAICGCMMAPTVSNYPFLAQNVGVECSDTCAISKIKIGQYNGGTFQPLECNSEICIISAAALTFIDSTTGSVTISQVCNSCAPSTGASGSQSSQCGLCYLDGVTISEINSQISGGTRVSQSCGACADASTGLPISCLGGGSSCSSNADCPVGESCGPNGICFENPIQPSSGFISKIVDWIQQHELVAVGSTSALVLMVGIILIFLGTRRRR